MVLTLPAGGWIDFVLRVDKPAGVPACRHDVGPTMAWRPMLGAWIDELFWKVLGCLRFRRRLRMRRRLRHLVAGWCLNTTFRT